MKTNRILEKKHIIWFWEEYLINERWEVYAKERYQREPRYTKKISTRMRQGYRVIRLCRWLEKTKQFAIHRLLAQHFIPNPNNYPYVNHKNGIKTDNRLENLEWCDWRQNNLHYDRFLKNDLLKIRERKEKNFKPPRAVIVYDDFLFEKLFDTMWEAAKFLWVAVSQVSRALKTKGKCRWYWVEYFDKWKSASIF